MTFEELEALDDQELDTFLAACHEGGTGVPPSSGLTGRQWLSHLKGMEANSSLRQRILAALNSHRDQQLLLLNKPYEDDLSYDQKSVDSTLLTTMIRAFAQWRVEEGI